MDDNPKAGGIIRKLTIIPAIVIIILTLQTNTVLLASSEESILINCSSGKKLTHPATKRNPVRNVCILGDYILKNIKPPKMRNVASTKDRIFIKSFSSATTDCMHHYVKPSLKHSPDLLILHCGTNDLRSEKIATQIATDIFDLAKSVKNDENDVIVSSVITRNDQTNTKGMKVNEYLKVRCTENNIAFCYNSNIKTDFISIYNNELIFEQSNIAEASNKFFIEIIDNLNIEPFSLAFTDDKTQNDITQIIKEYELHSSILKIEETFKVDEVFVFQKMSPQELKLKS